MPDHSPADPAGAASDGSPEERALSDALAQLLAPVARLAVARGLTYGATQEMLKLAFVEAASAAHPGLAEHRKVSRIATTTGINRREVTRLTAPRARGLASEPRPAARSLASELCAHWRTHPEWRDAEGQPRVLPRLGPAPSFEALAQAVTRDVHPRSLLDELCRLQLARLDEADDTVSLLGDAFVPRGDQARMLAVLGNNVGDHLRAAVDNVLATGRPPHLEQALFAEGLGAASLELLRPLLREQWTRLRDAVVPAVEARVAADAQAAASELLAPLRARLRIGLYAYQEVPGAHGAAGDVQAPPRPVPARRVGVRRAAAKESKS
jgi:hypothetical protein